MPVRWAALREAAAQGLSGRSLWHLPLHSKVSISLWYHSLQGGNCHYSAAKAGCRSSPSAGALFSEVTCVTIGSPVLAFIREQLPA